MIGWIGHGPPSRNRNGGKQPLPPPPSLTLPSGLATLLLFGSEHPLLTPPSGLATLVLWVWAGRAGALGWPQPLRCWQLCCCHGSAHHPLFASGLSQLSCQSLFPGQGVCYLGTGSPQTCPPSKKPCLPNPAQFLLWSPSCC